MNGWLSLHAFFHDAGLHTRLLRECVVPGIRQLQQDGGLRDWFFVRNWRGGPHVRIRLSGNSAALQAAWLVLGPRFEAFVRSHPVADVLDRDGYYRQHRHHVAQVAEPETLPWHPHGTLIEIPYEPEVDRYGGASLLPISERLFGPSSELALALLSAEPASRSALLTLAVDTMVLTAQTFGVANRAFFELYTRPWVGFVSDVAPFAGKVDGVLQRQGRAIAQRIRALAPETVREPHRSWLACVRNAAQELAARAAAGAVLPSVIQSAIMSRGAAIPDLVAFLAVSHIHMTNNRLGVLPAEELYLGMLLSRLFGDGDAAHGYDAGPAGTPPRALAGGPS